VFVVTGDAEGKALVQAFSGWKWHQQVVYRRQMPGNAARHYQS
jgi:hypothetical protein